MMSVAIKAVHSYHGWQPEKPYYSYENDYTDWQIGVFREYDQNYIDSMQRHPLVRAMQILVDHGLDSNTCLEGEHVNVMGELRYEGEPFLAAACMRVLLEHGADPAVRIGESDEDELFEELKVISR